MNKRFLATAKSVQIFKSDRLGVRFYEDGSAALFALAYEIVALDENGDVHFSGVCVNGVAANGQNHDEECCVIAEVIRGDVEELLETIKEPHPDLYWKFIKRQHEHMFGCHYNEVFGQWRIEQMYWKDKKGDTHHAPHWTKDQYKTAYEAVKAKIPATYNCWDFAVTLEMSHTDLICLFRTWWPDATDAELDQKVIEAAINYLNDDDDPDCKIWHRFEK